ncbi:MmgE/PrpD family protein [Streptomyces sp. NPDC002577]
MTATAAERTATTALPGAPVPEVTDELARFVAGLTHENVPAEVTARAGLLFLDTLGIVVAGQRVDSTAAMLRGLAPTGLAAGTARVPGTAQGFTPYGAALVAAASAHSLDYDDTHAPAGIHPGAPVVAAALAAAQLTSASTRDLLLGVVAGYEVMTRVALGLVPIHHQDAGFHLTATTGVFGAAAAAGKILGLDADQLAHAFGTALSQSAGSGQFLTNGAWTKRFHVGNAAAGGFLAASLAAQDYTGAAQAFEGDAGFFRLYSPAPQPEAAVRGLGNVWETLQVAVKPYPCCRAIHAPLDAALALRASHAPKPDNIRQIRVGMPRKCVDITGAPQERKRRPQNVVDCQFSAHLCIAAALVLGRLDVDYQDALHSEQVRALTQRVEVYVDAEAEAEYPRTFPGRVEIELTDGTVLREYVRVPKGEPDTMLTADELRTKFLSLAEPVLGTDRAQELFELVGRMHAEDIPVERLLAAAVPDAA